MKKLLALADPIKKYGILAILLFLIVLSGCSAEAKDIAGKENDAIVGDWVIDGIFHDGEIMPVGSYESMIAKYAGFSLSFTGEGTVVYNGSALESNKVYKGTYERLANNEDASEWLITLTELVGASDTIDPFCYVAELTEDDRLNLSIVYGEGKERATLYSFTRDSGGSPEQSAENDPADPSGAVSAMGNASVGDFVIFGSYEQDNNLENGTEEIEWMVLDRQDDSLRLISRFALDSRPYHTSRIDVTWEQSSLRKWLNDTFYQTAFSPEEQAAILKSEVSADQNPSADTSPGNPTEDQVFILSLTEAKLYFDYFEARACKPTAYAAAQGCTIDPVINCCDWWLRTPGNFANSALMVYAGGSIPTTGHRVDSADIAVRPVIRVKL